MTTGATSLNQTRFASLVAPHDLVTGQAVQIGLLFGVSGGEYKAGEPAQLAVEGKFEFHKPAGQSILAGDTVYWDEENHCVTRDMEGNVGIGIAIADSDDQLDRVQALLAPSTEDEAIEDLQRQIDELGNGGGGDVTSVFGRKGDVAAEAGDYPASYVSHVPSAEAPSTEVQGALNDLTSLIKTNSDDIAALTARVTQNESDIVVLQNRVQTLEDIVVHLIPAAHGGMNIANVKSGSDFSGNRIINDFDQINIQGVGVTLNTSNGTMAFDFAGRWFVSFSFSLKHDKDSERLMEWEFWDTQDGDQLGDSIFLYVPPDDEGTAYCIAVILDIHSSDVGHPLQWRVDGDNFSSIEWRQLNWNAHFIDELGTLGDPFLGR